MNLLKETHRIWAMHREFRTVRRELGNYTDRELSELGIGRGDLARIAYEEAERRTARPLRRPRTRPLVQHGTGRQPLAEFSSFHPIDYGGAHDDAAQSDGRALEAA